MGTKAITLSCKNCGATYLGIIADAESAIRDTGDEIIDALCRGDILGYAMTDEVEFKLCFCGEGELSEAAKLEMSGEESLFDLSAVK